LRVILADSQRLIVVDPLWEHDIGQVCYDVDCVAAKILRAKFRVVYRPGTHGDIERVFALAMAVARRQGGLTLAVDEVDLFTSSAYISPALKRLVHYGRHFAVDMVFVSRMPNRIRPDILAQVDEVITFQLQGTPKRYLAEYSDYTGGIESIPPYHYKKIL